MLRKLMKYELRATGRIFLPFFGALLALSVLNRIFYSRRFDRIIDTLHESNKGFPLEIIRILSAAIFGFTICAIFVLTVIVMIQRYYRNLLGDEGYLMFTLPVRPWQLITGKMVISCLWFIVSIVVTIVACILLAADLRSITQFFIGLPADLKQMHGMNLLHLLLLMLETGLMLLAYLCCFILMVYAAITIGQLWSAHKLLGAFGAFLLLNTASQILTASAFWAFDHLLDLLPFPQSWANEHILTVIHSGLWIVILWGALLSAGCFLICNQLLQKRLNLE